MMMRAWHPFVVRVGSTGAGRGAAPFLAAGILALAAGARGLDAESAATGQTGWLGKAAPDFALTNLSGKTVRLADFHGKVVLLDFWATWCAPCQMEIPKFIQLQKRYADKGFTMLGIALDDEGAAVVKPLAQKLGINYPVVIGKTRVAAAYGGMQALPTTFLIGRDGKILKTWIGAREKSEFAREISSALRQTGKRLID